MSKGRPPYAVVNIAKFLSKPVSTFLDLPLLVDQVSYKLITHNYKCPMSPSFSIKAFISFYSIPKVHIEGTPCLWVVRVCTNISVLLA